MSLQSRLDMMNTLRESAACHKSDRFCLSIILDLYTTLSNEVTYMLDNNLDSL